MNRYEFLWILCTISMLITGCAPFKEFIQSQETTDSAIAIATDAATGNWPGVVAKTSALAVACVLAVFGVKKLRAVKSAS